LQSKRNRAKFDSNAPQRSTAMRRNKRSSLKMQQTLQQTKKRDEEPGGRRGRFFYDRRHKKWHIQKAIFHSKRIYKNWKKIQKFPANASPVFQALGELGCREKQQNEASRPPTVSFSLSLSLSLSHPLSRAATVRFLPPADLPERDEGSTAFIQTTQFTVHPSIFHSGSTEFI